MPAIVASATYRQFGKPRLVMCAKPKSSDAVHHPAHSVLESRASKFCSSPRNKNSSGHAVKIRIATELNKNPLHRPHCGANVRKCIPVPSGTAMLLNTTKLPSTYNPQLFPHPIEEPIPFSRRTSTNAD